MGLHAEPAVASEAPVDATGAARHAGDVLADLAFKGWRPRHELEAETVVDRGEAARREREALAIGARHILARYGLRELPAGLGRKLVAQRFHRALAQRVDQPGREADAARLPLGEALANEMFGPPVHRVANLRADAATTEPDGIAGDRPPVEPGRAGRVDLPLDV